MVFNLQATAELTFSAFRCTPSTLSRTRPSFPLFLLTAEHIDLAYTTEIVSKDETGQPISGHRCAHRFVGYGIHAPEYHWNDYAGADGKDID